MTVPLTVVVPAHAYDERLAALLRDLDAQARAEGVRLPVIVSDDASPSPIEADVPGHELPSLDLVVTRSETNGGPGAARNRALALVGTPWVALMDSDELPGPRWLAVLTEVVGRADAPDVVEGPVTVGDARPTPFTHVTDVSAENDEHVAGNVAYRTEVLREAGGFSEAFFDAKRGVHFREDIELYFRLRAAGRRIEYVEDLVAFHPPGPPSFAVPLKEARRYYFDPLLDRLHPEQFRRSNAARRVGPIPLRRARHQAALLFVLASAGLALGLATDRRGLRRGSAVVLAGSWAANAAALTRRRSVPLRLVPEVAAAAALVPWVYLHSYYRGCLRHRHLPRL